MRKLMALLKLKIDKQLLTDLIEEKTNLKFFCLALKQEVLVLI